MSIPGFIGSSAIIRKLIKNENICSEFVRLCQITIISITETCGKTFYSGISNNNRVLSIIRKNLTAGCGKVNKGIQFNSMKSPAASVLYLQQDLLCFGDKIVIQKSRNL